MDEKDVNKLLGEVAQLKLDKTRDADELTKLRAFKESTVKTLADKDAIITKLQGVIADNVLAGEPADKAVKEKDDWNDNLRDYTVPKEYKANAYGR